MDCGGRPGCARVRYGGCVCAWADRVGRPGAAACWHGVAPPPGPCRRVGLAAYGGDSGAVVLGRQPAQAETGPAAADAPGLCDGLPRSPPDMRLRRRAENRLAVTTAGDTGEISGFGRAPGPPGDASGWLRRGRRPWVGPVGRRPCSKWGPSGPAVVRGITDQRPESPGDSWLGQAG
jgi:hypothetical protein